jgi:hypothetical protein
VPRAAYVDDAGVCLRLVTVSDLAFAPGALNGATANVGDRWDGAQWVRPVVKRAVPAEVTMRQARRALFAAGLLSAVDPSIAALPEPQRTAAAIDWEFSNAVERTNPTMAALAAALGLSDEQLDNLFISAEAIV